MQQGKAPHACLRQCDRSEVDLGRTHQRSPKQLPDEPEHGSLPDAPVAGEKRGMGWVLHSGPTGHESRSETNGGSDRDPPNVENFGLIDSPEAESHKSGFM